MVSVGGLDRIRSRHFIDYTLVLSRSAVDVGCPSPDMWADIMDLGAQLWALVCND